MKYILSVLVIGFLIGCGGSSGTKSKHTIKEDISMTKEIFSSLRSEALKMTNEDKNATLDKEAKLLANAMENISIDTDSVGNSISQLIDLIKDAQTQNQTTANNDHMKVTKNGDIWNYSIDNEYNGTITIPDNFSDFNISNFNDETFKIKGDLPKSQSADISINLKKTTEGAKLTIDKIILNSGENRLAISPLLADISYKYDGDQFTDKSIKLEKVVMQGKFQGFDIDGTLTMPSYVQNSTISDKEENNNGYLPSKLMFNGAIKDTKTENEFIGILNANWRDAKDFDLSKDNSKPDVTISFDGILKRKNSPQIKLSLGADIKKNEFTLSYENGKHKIDTVSNINEQGDGTIKITTPDGFEATVKFVDGDIDYENSSDIKVNGRKVGELVDRNGVPVIRYTDGTIESIF